MELPYVRMTVDRYLRKLQAGFRAVGPALGSHRTPDVRIHRGVWTVVQHERENPRTGLPEINFMIGLFPNRKAARVHYTFDARGRDALSVDPTPDSVDSYGSPMSPNVAPTVLCSDGLVATQYEIDLVLLRYRDFEPCIQHTREDQERLVSVSLLKEPWSESLRPYVAHIHEVPRARAQRYYESCQIVHEVADLKGKTLPWVIEQSAEGKDPLAILHVALMHSGYTQTVDDLLRGMPDGTNQLTSHDRMGPFPPQ